MHELSLGLCIKHQDGEHQHVEHQHVDGTPLTVTSRTELSLVGHYWILTESSPKRSQW